MTCSVTGRRHGLSVLITQGGGHDSRPRKVLALLRGDPDLPVGPGGCGFHWAEGGARESLARRTTYSEKEKLENVCWSAELGCRTWAVVDMSGG